MVRRIDSAEFEEFLPKPARPPLLGTSAAVEQTENLTS